MLVDLGPVNRFMGVEFTNIELQKLEKRALRSTILLRAKSQKEMMSHWMSNELPDEIIIEEDLM